MAYDGSTIPRSGSGASGSTSSSLLERVKAHDAVAWQRLVRIYGPLVYQWCRECGLQAQDIADTFQEVFSSVSLCVSQFRRERPSDSFRGWLWTITRNKIRDHFRSIQGQAQAQGGTAAQQQLAQLPERLLEDSEPSRTDAPEVTSEYRALEAIRAEFEDRTWDAFWRTTVDGLTAAEAAAELGTTPEAVYKAKSRVLRRIREELSGMLDG